METKKITFRIRPDIHRRFKLIATERDVSMKDLIEKFMEREISEYDKAREGKKDKK